MTRKRKRLGLILLLAAMLGVTGYQMVWPWLDGSGWQRRAAERAVQERDFRRALTHLHQAIAAAPNDLSLQLAAAQAARRQGDFDEALQRLEAYHARRGPAGPLEREHRLLRAQKGDLTEVDMLLSKCLDEPWDEAAPLLLEAAVEGYVNELARLNSLGLMPDGSKAAHRAEQVRQALELWRRQCRAPNDRVQELIWRGRLHFFASEHRQAVADLRQAVELNPDHFNARLHLATTIAQEAPLETAAHFELLRQRQPDNVSVLFSLASIRRNLGELEASRLLLHELLQAQPHHVAGLIERGKVAMDQGHMEEAEQWLRQALEREPNHAEANLTMSRCLLRAGREEAAQQYRDKLRQFEAAKKQGLNP